MGNFQCDGLSSPLHYNTSRNQTAFALGENQREAEVARQEGRVPYKRQDRNFNDAPNQNTNTQSIQPCIPEPQPAAPHEMLMYRLQNFWNSLLNR
jgi:hypothetical protein